MSRLLLINARVRTYLLIETKIVVTTYHPRHQSRTTVFKKKKLFVPASKLRCVQYDALLLVGKTRIVLLLCLLERPVLKLLAVRNPIIITVYYATIKRREVEI